MGFVISACCASAHGALGGGLAAHPLEGTLGREGPPISGEESLTGGMRAGQGVPDGIPRKVTAKS